MKTICSMIENELVIKNSRFITLLFPINSKEDVSFYLDKAKEKYPKATHYCYAYKLFFYKKCEDDGEPSTTAGMPILNVLDSEELENVLCIVIRYFGGIKLGAGGLIRAYSKSASTCIHKAELKELEEGFKVEIIFDYSHVKIMDYLLRNSVILDKKFDTSIVYLALLNTNTLTLLDEKNISYRILEQIYIQKNSV